MDQTKEKWDEAFERLTFTDDYIFKLVMEEVELFKAVLALILPQVNVEQLTSLETEKPMTLDYFLHGVRFDILAKGLKKLIDIEIQVLDTGELPERALYYLASLIVSSLKKGQTYNLLGESYVVFFCKFDPFGKGRPVYEFQLACNGLAKLKLTDKVRVVFYNAPAWRKCKNKALRALLRYMMTGEATSELTRKIDAAVSEAKHNSKTRGGWNMLYETMVQQYDKGVSVGSHERAVANARAFLQMGLPVEQVAQGTALPLDEVQSLL